MTRLESYEREVSLDCPVCGREGLAIVDTEINEVSFQSAECSCFWSLGPAELMALEARAIKAANTPPEPLGVRE